MFACLVSQLKKKHEIPKSENVGTIFKMQIQISNTGILEVLLCFSQTVITQDIL